MIPSSPKGLGFPDFFEFFLSFFPAENPPLPSHFPISAFLSQGSDLFGHFCFCFCFFYLWRFVVFLDSHLASYRCVIEAEEVTEGGEVGGVCDRILR